jgi:hypothetical protein
MCRYNHLGVGVDRLNTYSVVFPKDASLALGNSIKQVSTR